MVKDTSGKKKEDGVSLLSFLNRYLFLYKYLRSGSDHYYHSGSGFRSQRLFEWPLFPFRTWFFGHKSSLCDHFSHFEPDFLVTKSLRVTTFPTSNLIFWSQSSSCDHFTLPNPDFGQKGSSCDHFSIPNLDIGHTKLSSPLGVFVIRKGTNRHFWFPIHNFKW